MNSDILERLAQLDKAATPGPWFVRLLDDEHAMSAVAVCTKAQPGVGGSMREGLGLSMTSWTHACCRNPAMSTHLT
jgi:hypothetical protein